MEPVLQSILESLPTKSPRSKLEPHHELIGELRRKGRTYREVARLFHERLRLHVAPSTLRSFVKVRAKHRKRTQFELPPIETTPSTTATLDPIAALKAKSPVPKSTGQRFVFRENEPLKLTSRGGAQCPPPNESSSPWAAKVASAKPASLLPWPSGLKPTRSPLLS